MEGQGSGCGEGDIMETDKKMKLSKSKVEKLAKAWKGRHDWRKKRKRLSHGGRDKW